LIDHTAVRQLIFILCLCSIWKWPVLPPYTRRQKLWQSLYFYLSKGQPKTYTNTIRT